MSIFRWVFSTIFVKSEKKVKMADAFVHFIYFFVFDFLNFSTIFVGEVQVKLSISKPIVIIQPREIFFQYIFKYFMANFYVYLD